METENVTTNSPANWRARQLRDDPGWIYTLGDGDRARLVQAVRGAPPAGNLLDHERGDFDLGNVGAVLEDALGQVKAGRGVAMIRGLPREDLTEDEFRLLSWVIGLHAGVARPQGKAAPYITAVRDEGTVYRTGRGRGYSSNAQLDYHTDSADLVFLSCYNRAESGGMSLTTSTLAAYDEMERRHPQQVHWLREPLHFSRQGEEAPDEGPTCRQPVYDTANGHAFCRWNWNRVNSAQLLAGIPPLHPEHRDALEKFDAIVRDPELVHSFWMEPGDLQIINSHRTLHSRTEFVDATEPSGKRLMYRLWIAPPDSPELPRSWSDLYRHTEAGSVRGGIRGSGYDARCEAYERRQAQDAGARFIV